MYFIYFFNLSLPNRFVTLLSILKKNFKKLFYKNMRYIDVAIIIPNNGYFIYIVNICLLKKRYPIIIINDNTITIGFKKKFNTFII